MEKILLPMLLVLGLSCSGTRTANDTTSLEDANTHDGGVDVSLDVLQDTHIKEAVDAPSNPDTVDVTLPDVPGKEIFPDEVDPPDLVQVYEHMDLGKYWLTVAEPVFALREFQKAIELSPVHLQEAYFGAALARFISAGELLGMILSLPAQLAGYGAGDGATKIANSENEYIMETLRQAFVDLRGTFVEADEYFAQVQEVEGVLFDISGAPMYFTVRPILVFRGKFDLGDLYLMRSASAFGLWASGLLAAQSLSTDLGVLVATVKGLDSGLDIFSLLSTISYLMEVSPGFLGLDPNSGEELFQEGAKNMKDAGKYLVKALDYLEAHPDEGEDHVTAYEQSGANTLIRFRNRIMAKDLSEKETKIKFSADLIQDMRDLVMGMDEPGAVVPWSKGPAVQLGTAVALLQAMGIMDYIPIDLPIDISMLGPDQMVSLLRTFFSDAFGFNYSGFFGKPAGLRSFLPTFSVKIDGQERLLVEWECPEEVAALGGKPGGKGDLVCTKEAALTDLAHFEGTDHLLPADGVTTALPYLVFGDPTWSDFLRVAQGAGTGTLGPDWLVADLDLMNKGLHDFMKGLEPLLQ